MLMSVVSQYVCYFITMEDLLNYVEDLLHENRLF